MYFVSFESIAFATAITPVEPGDVLYMGTNHQGLGALHQVAVVELAEVIEARRIDRWLSYQVTITLLNGSLKHAARWR